MADAANSKSTAGHYDANYTNFESDIYAAIRREAFGEDLGQNSWLTADELLEFLPHLALTPQKKLLDVACGAGGPALTIAQKTGCSITGIDVHEQAIAAAKSLAASSALASRSEFHVVNASGTLAFAECSFDVVTCIDAINHLPDRPAVIADWTRVLKPGGRLLFTDPITVTGPISQEEISARTSPGFFLFVPPDYDRKVLAEIGMRLLLCHDVTENMSRIAQTRRVARGRMEEALRKIEGSANFEQQQQFLEVAARLAQERRLSRFLYVAQKPFGTGE